MQAVIDRFEEDKAVLLIGEDEQKVVFPCRYLPENVAEGDFLDIKITYDEKKTVAMREETEALLRSLEESQ